MATLSLTVPDEVVPRIRKAFHPSQDGVQMATVDEVREALLDYIKRKVIRLEGSAAQEAAWQTVATEVNTSIPFVP